MNRFSEKQMLLMTIAGFLVIVLGFGALIYMDVEAIYAAEVTDSNPDSLEIVEPEEWGERRKIQELQKQIDTAKAESELIPKREQDVIVYREIVARDSLILPSANEVNQLAHRITEFERLAGVHLSRVSNLDTNHGGQAIATIPFALEVSGSYDEILKFLNLFEQLDRLVNTQAFSIASGPVLGEGRDAKASHRGTLNLVTYMYTSTAGLSKPVEISNYDKRKADPVIQKLIRQQKAAYVEGYQLKQRINRRDPLVDPRRPIEDTESGTGGEDRPYQEELVQRLSFEIEMLKEDVRQEAVYMQEKKYVQLAQIKAMIDRKVAALEAEITAADPKITIADLREIFHDKVLTPFEAIKSQRETYTGPSTVRKQEVLDFLERMQEQSDGREYEAVVRTHEEFLGFVSNRDLNEDATTVVSDMEELRQQAQVMLDFERLDLKYSGAILRPGGGSIIIVGGKARRVDDYVDPASRCRVVAIRKDEVVYEFNGYEIVDLINTK